MKAKVNRRTIDLTGFLRFAPPMPARGKMFSARERAQHPGEQTRPVPVAEEEFYS